MSPSNRSVLPWVLVSALSGCLFIELPDASDRCFAVRNASCDWNARCWTTINAGLDAGYAEFCKTMRFAPGAADCDSFGGGMGTCPNDQHYSAAAAEGCVDQLQAASCSELDPPSGSPCASICP